MGPEAAGSVFWAVFLLQFPVSGSELPSDTCVTYKHREVCGLKGSSVEIPCSYRNDGHIISLSGWSKELRPDADPEPLTETHEYSDRVSYPERGNDDCTLKLMDLKYADASTYYFVYNFTSITGEAVTCRGDPGVRLRVLAYPVRIQVGELVRGQVVPLRNRIVTEGQRIKLTCVLTCSANLNSSRGYIWSRRRRQLNGTRANFLSLDPISAEDTGSYDCAVIGYEDLPSPAVTLYVLRTPRGMVESGVPDGGSKEDDVPSQISTNQTLTNHQTPNNKVTRMFSVMVVAGVGVGLVTVILVAVLVHKVKKKRRCAGSDTNTPTYMTLHIKSQESDYETLDTVRQSPAVEPVYEELNRPEMTKGL